MKISQNFLSLLNIDKKNFYQNNNLINNNDLNNHNSNNNLYNLFEKSIFYNKIKKHNSINTNLIKINLNKNNFIIKGIPIKHSFFQKKPKINYKGIDGLNFNKENINKNKSFEINLHLKDKLNKNSIIENNLQKITKFKNKSNSLIYLTKRNFNNIISLEKNQKFSCPDIYTSKKINFPYQKEISIMNLLRTSKDEINLKNLNKNYHNYPKTKYSSPYTKTKYVKAFAANSYKGKYPLENQNKIVISLNVEKNKKSINNWPYNFSIFCLYDGFNGKTCSEYLSENLSENIIKNHSFLNNYSKGIIEGYLMSENLYKKKIYENKIFNNDYNSKKNYSLENSGSMSVNVFIIEDIIFISSLGDSRVLISKNNLSEYFQINSIHNSLNLSEKKRILKNGGYFKNTQMNWNNLPDNIIAPKYEVVMPCKLRTTRCFGAFNSKKLNKELILLYPEINKVKINEYLDLLFMGNQEIFNRLNNNDIFYCIKMIFFTNCEHNEKNNNCYLCLHKKCHDCIDLIIKSAQKKGALGNLSCILIVFNEKIGYISSL